MQISIDTMHPEIASKIYEALEMDIQKLMDPELRWNNTLPIKMNLDLQKGVFGIRSRRDPNQDEQALIDKLHQEKMDRFFHLICSFILYGIVAYGTFSFAMMIYYGMLGRLADMQSLTPAIWGELGLLLSCTTAHFIIRPQRINTLSAPEMRALFSRLSLNRAQRIYCDMLILVSQIPQNEVPDKTLHESLKHADQLMNSYNLLDKKRIAIGNTLGSQNIEELTQECESLRSKVANCADPFLIGTYRSNLEMCEVRLGNAIAIQKNYAKIKSEQDTVIQTLLALNSGIARQFLAPELYEDIEVGQTASSIQEVFQQITSVESAVEEILHLRNSD